jgi:2-isopropylmalate synthase
VTNEARIITYDCTLRDGEQGAGISFSLEDKLAIVSRLDAFGIDVIEGGFPASNPKDIAFFKRVQTLGLKHARIAAFGSTCRKGTPAEVDGGLADIVASGAPIATIVGKSWDAQVTRALRTSLEENLRMVRDSVAFLKRAGMEVVFDAEHFFDGYRANPDYAISPCSTRPPKPAPIRSTCARPTGACCPSRCRISSKSCAPACPASASASTPTTTLAAP